MIFFSLQCWLAHSLRKYAIYDWSIEQKWMSVLLPLLLLYNGELLVQKYSHSCSSLSWMEQMNKNEILGLSFIVMFNVNFQGMYGQKKISMEKDFLEIIL